MIDSKVNGSPPISNDENSSNDTPIRNLGESFLIKPGHRERVHVCREIEGIRYSNEGSIPLEIRPSIEQDGKTILHRICAIELFNPHHDDAYRRKIRATPHLTNGAKEAWEALVERTGPANPSSWPSYSTIASEIAKSRRQAIRSIQELRWKGLLLVRARSHTSNQFYFIKRDIESNWLERAGVVVDRQSQQTIYFVGDSDGAGGLADVTGFIYKPGIHPATPPSDTGDIRIRDGEIRVDR